MPRTERFTVRSVETEQIKRLRILSVVLEEPMPELVTRMLKEFCNKEEVKLEIRTQVA